MAHSPSQFDSSYNRFSVFEGLSVSLIPAPLSKRMAAYLIDLGIISCVGYLFFLIGTFVSIFFIGLFTAFAGDAKWSSIILIIFLILASGTLYHGYFVYQEYKNGTTLGKKIFGLQVIPVSTPRLTLGQCILRDMIRYIDCTLIIPGILSILLTKKNQRLGDLAAGTLVVHSSQKEREKSFAYISQEQYHLFKDALKPASLPLEVCRGYLNFSHPVFITRKLQPTAEEFLQWESFVKYYVPKSKDLSVDQTSLFLFFGEFCLQTLNGNPD